jgi:SAM-dependent methyltransferase
MNAYRHPASLVIVSESQLDPAHDRCPICDSGRRASLVRVLRVPDVWLLYCHECHACSASRMPTAQALAEIYSSFWSKATARDEQVIFDHPERLARHLSRALVRRLAGETIRILDFGGGDGTMSVMLGEDLLAAGSCGQVQITVVDVSGHARESTGRVSIEHRRGLDEVRDLSQDFVMASAVLEHVPSPAVIIRKLLGSLRPGGIFYARTPFMRPLLRALPFPSISNQLFPYPMHLHDMGPDFWKTSLRVLGMGPGFEIVISRPTMSEGTFDKHFLRTLAARALKAPWRLLGDRYGLVGGWEVFIRRFPAIAERAVPAMGHG